MLDFLIVKESSGSNGYPNCWRMFTELKDRCQTIGNKERVIYE